MRSTLPHTHSGQLIGKNLKCSLAKSRTFPGRAAACACRHDTSWKIDTRQTSSSQQAVSSQLITICNLLKAWRPAAAAPRRPVPLVLLFAIGSTLRKRYSSTPLYQSPWQHWPFRLYRIKGLGIIQRKLSLQLQIPAGKLKKIAVHRFFFSFYK